MSWNRLCARPQSGRRLLDSLVAKKWVTREDVSAVRDARRTVEFVESGEIAGKLNASQQKIVEVLQASGGRARTDTLANWASRAARWKLYENEVLSR